MLGTVIYNLSKLDPYNAENGTMPIVIPKKMLTFVEL